MKRAIRWSLLLFTVVTGGVYADDDADFNEGVRLYQLGDFKGAIDMLVPVADKGNTKAMVYLGYVLDYTGLNEDAFSWYQRASDAGDLDGDLGLAQMIAAGELAEPDPERSRQIVLNAAEKGSAKAVRMVALWHMSGENGFDKDEKKGLEMLQKAADMGSKLAAQELKNREERAEQEKADRERQERRRIR
jgi:TPR repeat protein